MFYQKMLSQKLSTQEQSYHQCSKLRTTKDEHIHDLAYHAKFPECNETYIGETGSTLQDSVDEHAGKKAADHVNVRQNFFQILRNGYKKMKFKRKLSKALYIFN